MSATPTVATSFLEAANSTTNRNRRWLDVAAEWFAFSGAGIMLLLLGLLAVVLIEGAWPAMMKHGIKFLYTSEWDPVEMSFGALPMIVGTIVTSLLALVIAVPASVGVALFLERIGPRWLTPMVAFMVELLAAIPSITYGFWGVAVMVPFTQKIGAPFLKATIGKVPLIGQLFSGPAYGFSVLASSIVLAIMILPTITLVTRDVLRTVPREVEQGSYALGATWWQATKMVLIYAKLGILGAITLGLARAVGETMAVCMIIGNSNLLDLKKYSLFAPGQTMASLLANEFLEADKPEYMQALVYVAAVLLAFTLVMNIIARWFVGMVGEQKRSSRPKEEEGDLGAIANKKKEEKPINTSYRNERLLPKIEPVWHSRWVKFSNKLMRLLCYVCFIGAIGILGMILGFVFYKGISSLNMDFFTKLPGPIGTPTGMRNCILGTLILVALGSCFGIPVGVLTGVYLSEYAKPNKFNNLLRLMVDVMAGTPSIIVGVMAYEIIVKPMGNPSGIAGGLALGFLMCPVIARTTEEMLRLVPRAFREGSLALGSSKYHTIVKVVFPAASAGIVTGILLSIARVAGETAPLIFTTIGFDSDVFDPRERMPALTLKIYQYATSAEPTWISQAWAGMLVLVMCVLLFSIAVRFVTRGRTAGAK